MVTVICKITSALGFENLKKTITHLEYDQHLGVNLLCLVNDKQLFLNMRDYCQEAYDIGQHLVVFDDGDIDIKNLLTGSDEYVLVLNENVVLPRCAISDFYDVYKQDKNAGLVTGDFVEYNIPYWTEDFYSNVLNSSSREEHRINNEIIEIDTTPIFAILTKIELYTELSLETPLEGLGSSSYGIRLRRLGYRNYMTTKVSLRYSKGENK